MFFFTFLTNTFPLCQSFHISCLIPWLWMPYFTLFYLTYLTLFKGTEGVMLSEFSLYAAHTVSSDCSQRTQWVQNVHSQHSEFKLYAAHTVSLDCTLRIPEFAANHTKADLNTFTHISLYTTNKKSFYGYSCKSGMAFFVRRVT